MHCFKCQIELFLLQSSVSINFLFVNFSSSLFFSLHRHFLFNFPFALNSLSLPPNSYQHFRLSNLPITFFIFPITPIVYILSAFPTHSYSFYQHNFDFLCFLYLIITFLASSGFCNVDLSIFSMFQCPFVGISSLKPSNFNDFNNIVDLNWHFLIHIFRFFSISFF